MISFNTYLIAYICIYLISFAVYIAIEGINLTYLKKFGQKVPVAFEGMIDEKELQNTKSNLKYGFAMGIDDPSAIANSISHYIQLTGDPESINRLYAMYDKVTNEDIKMVANKYYVESALTIATISSDEKGGVE